MRNSGDLKCLALWAVLQSNQFLPVFSSQPPCFRIPFAGACLNPIFKKKSHYFQRRPFQVFFEKHTTSFFWEIAFYACKIWINVRIHLISGKELLSCLIAKVCSRPFQHQERISCILRLATTLWLVVFCFICDFVCCEEEGMIVGTCCCTGVSDLAAVGVNQHSSGLTSLD